MPESEKKIIDLTMTIKEGMQTFTAYWHPFIEITQMGRHGIENRETRKITLGTHSGTHVDAPLHFIKNGETIDNIPLTTLVGPAALLDFSSASDFSQLEIADIKQKLGTRPIKRLIIRFDWDIRALGTGQYYTDHPFFSADACNWLVDNGCELIALDTPQPDNPLNGKGSSNDAENHKILLGNKVIIVEYLVNLNQISTPMVELVVAPLKIQGGDGAPARCFAIEM